MMRVLIGGVGYRNLRDHSFGVELADRLASRRWPPHVSVEDLSYNPIAVVQRLQDDPTDQRFDVAIIAGAARREGRGPGTLSVYRWNKRLPSREEIHGAITEAVTGIISLDNTLVIAGYFGVWPATVVVVEIEPEAHEFGDELTAPVAAALERAMSIVTALALEPAAAAECDEAPLASGRAHHSGVELSTVAHDVRAH